MAKRRVQQRVAREDGFARQATGKLADMREAINNKKCAVAFAKLIDGVSYAGMAEAEAASAGKSGTKYAAAATDAMKSFRSACKIGGE